MSTEQTTSKISVKGAFALGAGSALVVGALVVFALRHDGRADVIAQPVQPAQQVAASIQELPPASEATTVATTEPKATPGRVAHPSSPTGDTASLISGTIALDPSLAKSISGKTIVFIIARSGGGKGHPLFAKRLDVTSFPVAFSLGLQDSMMGDKPPGHVSLEARIDLDGDAMTKEPNAPSVKIGDVALGSHDVLLTLKRGV